MMMRAYEGIMLAVVAMVALIPAPVATAGDANVSSTPLNRYAMLMPHDSGE